MSYRGNRVTARMVRRNLKTLLDGQEVVVIGGGRHARGFLVPVPTIGWARDDERRAAIKRAIKKLVATARDVMRDP